LETDLPGEQYGMAEEFTEKLIERVRLYGSYKIQVIFARAFPLLTDFVHPPPSLFSFTTHCYQKKKFFLIGTGYHELKKNN